MNPVGRRNFAKTLGLVGLLSIGVKGYQEVTERIVYKEDEIPTKELEAQLEGKPVLQLMATYGEEIPQPTYSYNGNPYLIFHNGPHYKEGTKKEVSVRMVPGPDGKLYVKENDTWRKI
jgi:hypothetical protein